jgi:hypothetical protein
MPPAQQHSLTGPSAALLLAKPAPLLHPQWYIIGDVGAPNCQGRAQHELGSCSNPAACACACGCAALTGSGTRSVAAAPFIFQSQMLAAIVVLPDSYALQQSDLRSALSPKRARARQASSWYQRSKKRPESCSRALASWQHRRCGASAPRLPLSLHCTRLCMCAPAQATATGEGTRSALCTAS